MTAPTNTAIRVRAAEPLDVPMMVSLMQPFIDGGDLLPRTPMDLLRDLVSFVVAVTADGRVVGTGALRRFTPQLAEVQALAVSQGHQGAGIGRQIVERLLVTATRDGIREVFALTRRTDFFERLAFSLVDRDRFPDKIWADCSRCPRQHACDEVAVHRTIAS